MRHFLRDDDLAPAEQAAVLERAAALKADRYSTRPLAGPRTVAILFDKPTLRTQLSFTVGVTELGGYPLVVDGKLAMIGVRESVADVARVLGPQVAAIVWRTFAQTSLEEMAAFAGVPVVNALTDDFHPCQILADLLTVREEFGDPAGRTLAYVGDGANNMAHSYLLGGATAGMHVRIGTPAGYLPDERIVADAAAIASATGGSVQVLHDAVETATGADVVATDTWVSMGQETEADERSEPFRPFQVSEDLMAKASPEAIALHCLPAYRGREITAGVVDGPASRVWTEAENRLHAQKALLCFLLEEPGSLLEEPGSLAEGPAA